MKLPRPRLTYANVVASLALFVALGGVSYAATTLPKGSVGPEQIQAEAVRTGKFADDAVTAAKLAKGVRERLVSVGGTPAVTTTTPTPESVKHAETADRAGDGRKRRHGDDGGRRHLRRLGRERRHGRPCHHFPRRRSPRRPARRPLPDRRLRPAVRADRGGRLHRRGGQWPGRHGAGPVLAAPAGIAAGRTHHRDRGRRGTVQCPGAGQAAAGYMCVYSRSTKA